MRRMTSDIPSSRRDLILARLAAGQPVRSGGLAEEFSVSEDAIRRDLRGLAAEGLCRRVYGGALPIVRGAVPMAARVEHDIVRKRALADTGLGLLRPGSFVFLDNGSTNLALAEAMSPEMDLTVATGSIGIAAVLERREAIDLILVGGAVDRMIGGSVDAAAIEAVSRMNIDLCVLGACALSVEGGVSAFETADANFKRALIARSRETIVLVTNDKLGERAPHRIAGPDGLSRIVVEHDAPDEAVRALEATGATIVRGRP